MRYLEENTWDYSAVPIEAVYPGIFSGTEKYMVISDLAEEELYRRYPEAMRGFAPFVLVTKEIWQVFEEDMRREDRERKMIQKHEILTDPQDIKNLKAVNAFTEKDASWGHKCCELRGDIAKACKELTPNQTNRLIRYVFMGETAEEIAKRDNVSRQCVLRSIRKARWKLRKIKQAKAV